MSDVEHLIGLLLGTEDDWPRAFETLLRRLGPVSDDAGDSHALRSVRVTIEPFNLRYQPRHSLVIDRLAYWYYVPREWLKKVAMMDDVYLLNSPFTFQSMEKHAAYCAMMRLGLKVPETVLVPYKNPLDNSRYAYTAARYNQPFDLDAIAQKIGYPLFMKPYDGGAWRGVSRINNVAELHAAYDASGEMLMHLQKAIDYDVFARSLSIGAETMVMKFQPDQPMHLRYAVEHDFLSPDAGLEVVTSNVPDRSSTSSHSRATSGPSNVMNAEATCVPIKRAPPGWRRTTFGRILPSLSTGLDLALNHRPDHGAGHQFRRKRPCFDRGDDHLPATGHFLQQGSPALAVQLGQNIVQQEQRTLAGAVFDQCRLGQLQAHHSRSLLALGGVRTSLLAIQKHRHVVPVWTDACGPPLEVLGQGVIHSFGQVFRRPLVTDFEPLARRDLSVAASCFGLQLAHRPGAGGHDLASDLDQLLVPGVEHVVAAFARSDPLEQAVALLQHAAQPGQRAGVTGLHLDQHLVEEAAAELGAGLDQTEVVGPEKDNPEVARQIDGSAPHAVDFDRPPRALAFDIQADGDLTPRRPIVDLCLDPRARAGGPDQLQLSARPRRG